MTDQHPRIALSIDDAAQQAGLGRDQVYKAIRNGQLIARKAGRRTLILRSDLEAYLSNLPCLDLDKPP